MKRIRFLPFLIRQTSVMDTADLISTDPFGSYTGLVHDQNEKPVQDADDL